MANLTRAQRLKAIQEAYVTWEERHERAVEPDPAFVRETNTQYPEGIVAVSATPRMDAELIAMIGEAATYPFEETVASVFHQPGKHDQRSHGHKRRFTGGLPGDWKSVSTNEATKHTVKQSLMQAPWDELPPQDLLEQGAKAMLMNAECFRSGDNLVAVGPDSKISDRQLSTFLGHVDTLSARFPVRGGVNIYVDTLMPGLNPPSFETMIMGPSILAETVKGTGMMHISDMAARGRLTDRPNVYRANAGQAILAHEWGHTQDHGPGGGDATQKALYRTLNSRNSSQYAREGGPDEAFAEAFSDYFTTSQGSHKDFQWSSTADYTSEYGWDFEAERTGPRSTVWPLG